MTKTKMNKGSMRKRRRSRTAVLRHRAERLFAALETRSAPLLERTEMALALVNVLSVLHPLERQLHPKESSK